MLDSNQNKVWSVGDWVYVTTCGQITKIEPVAEAGGDLQATVRLQNPEVRVAVQCLEKADQL